MSKDFNEKKWTSPDGHVRTTHRPEEEVKLRAAGYTPFEDNAPKGAKVQNEVVADETDETEGSDDPDETTKTPRGRVK